MDASPDFAGRHVVITGGAGALGGAVVEAFLAAGATCHLPVLETEGPARAGPAQESLHKVWGIDLTVEAQVSAFYAGLPSLYASVHLAGGFHAAPVLDTTRAMLEQQLTLNLLTAFLCSREAIRTLRRSGGGGGGGGGGGRIVNVGSRASEVPAGGMLAYTISKAGVAALTRALAEEVRGDSILVNAVLPSIIDTPANRAAMPKAEHNRWPKPPELAAAILWLASPANRLTSGTLLPVYGNA